MATTNGVDSDFEEIVFCPWPGLAFRIPTAIARNHPYAFALITLLIFCYFYWPSGTKPTRQNSGQVSDTDAATSHQPDSHKNSPPTEMEPNSGKDTVTASSVTDATSHHAIQPENGHQNSPPPEMGPTDNGNNTGTTESITDATPHQPESHQNSPPTEMAPNNGKDTVTASSDNDTTSHHVIEPHQNLPPLERPPNNGNNRNITSKEAVAVLLRNFWRVAKRRYLWIILFTAVVILLSLCLFFLGPLVMLNHGSSQDGHLPIKSQENLPVTPDVNSQTSGSKTSSKKPAVKPLFYMPWPGALIRIPTTSLPWTFILIPALYFCFRCFSKLNMDWSKLNRYRKIALCIILILMAALFVHQQLFPSNHVGIIQELLRVISVNHHLSDAEAGLCSIDTESGSKFPEEDIPPQDNQAPTQLPPLGQHPDDGQPVQLPTQIQSSSDILPPSSQAPPQVPPETQPLPVQPPAQVPASHDARPHAEQPCPTQSHAQIQLSHSTLLSLVPVSPDAQPPAEQPSPAQPPPQFLPSQDAQHPSPPQAPVSHGAQLPPTQSAPHVQPADNAQPPAEQPSPAQLPPQAMPSHNVQHPPTQTSPQAPVSYAQSPPTQPAPQVQLADNAIPPAEQPSPTQPPLQAPVSDDAQLPPTQPAPQVELADNVRPPAEQSPPAQRSPQVLPSHNAQYPPTQPPPQAPASHDAQLPLAPHIELADNAQPPAEQPSLAAQLPPQVLSSQDAQSPLPQADNVQSPEQPPLQSPLSHDAQSPPAQPPP